MIHRTYTIEIDEDYLNYLATARGDVDTRSEVVMVLPRPGSKVLVLTKSFYPEGTYNLPSGGIHPGETPEEAFVREVSEETGLKASPIEMIGIIERHCVAGEKTLDFTSYVILGNASTEAPHPSDESENISGYLDADERDLREFAKHMLRLSGRWQGFGRFRSVALQFVADYLAELPNRTG